MLPSALKVIQQLLTGNDPMKNTTLLATAVLAISTFAFASTTDAADIHQIRHEANHLKAKSNELKGLFHAHYRFASNYTELECAILEFREIAFHIREHAFQSSCDIDGLRDDIRLAERRFADVEHAAYRAERCVVSDNRGKAGIASHIRKILNQTDFCLDELRGLVTPVVHVHRPADFDSPRFDPPGRGFNGWQRTEPPRPQYRRDYNFGRSSSIRLGSSNFPIYFNW